MALTVPQPVRVLRGALMTAAVLGGPIGCGDDAGRDTALADAGPAATSLRPDNAQLVAANDALKADEATDSDGDGLADGLEEQLGTSPFLADTDFDGYADGRELLELGFDPGPDGNPVRFNPRIADVPRLEVRVTAPPRVYLTHTLSDSSTKSFDNSSSVENSTGFTSTSGGGSSVRDELSATIGSKASATAGLNPSVTGEISSSITASQAHENSLNWSDTQTRDHRETLSESRGFSETSDVMRSGGRVEVAVDLHNPGNVAFTLGSLALRLQKYDPVAQQRVDIGSLEPESDRVFTGITSLTPDETLRGMVFRAVLELEEAELLLGDGPMTVETLHYDLQDVDARSFDHRYTDILANTTALTIDRGDGEVPATYFVAAYAADGGGIALSDALTGVLGLPHRVGTTLWNQPGGEGGRTELRDTRPGILELDGLAADAASGSYWVVRVTTRIGDRSSRTELYHPLRDGPELADLRLKSNQSAELMYIRDADGDGLGARAEAALGLNPRAADTDGDGVNDGDELERGTNPHHGVAMVEALGVGARDRTLVLRLRARPREDGRLDGLQIHWGDADPRGPVATADGSLARNPVVFAGGPATVAGAVETVPIASRPGDPTDFFELEVSHEYPAFGEYTLNVAPVENGVAAAPTPLRVRVAPALVRAGGYAVPENSMMSFVAARPGGGGAVLYYTERVDKELQARLVALDRDARPQWRVQPPAWEDPSERLALLGGGRQVAVGPRGEVYLLMGHRVFCYSPAGEELWVTDVLSGAVSGKTRANALVVGADGRVYVGGSHDRKPFVSCIGAAASRAWTTHPDAFTRSVSQLALLSDGVMAYGNTDQGGSALVRLGASGEVVGDPVFHPHPAAAIAGTPGGTVVLGGGISSQETNDQGESELNLQAGVWAFRPGGNLAWGELTPRSRGQSLVKNVAAAADGWVYTVGFATQRGLKAKPAPDDRHPLNLRVDVRDPAGRIRSTSPVASLTGQHGLAVLLLPVGLAVDGADVWVAWTHQRVDTESVEGAEKPEEISNVHIDRWEPNPRGTRLLPNR